MKTRYLPSPDESPRTDPAFFRIEINFQEAFVSPSGVRLSNLVQDVIWR